MTTNNNHPLLHRVLNVPGFALAEVVDVRPNAFGGWLKLEAVNLPGMVLWRHADYIAALLGCEIVNGHFNARDTMEIDPVTIDEPALDPDDTELLPAPDVKEFDTLEGLNAGEPTPWISGGMPELTGLEMLTNMRYMAAHGVTFKLSNWDGVFHLSANVSAGELNAFWQSWHGGIKEPLAEKQVIERWLDDQFVPHTIHDKATDEYKVLTLLERIRYHEQWMIEELAAAREQLETMRSEWRKTAPSSDLSRPAAVVINTAFEADADNPRNAA